MALKIWYNQKAAPKTHEQANSRKDTGRNFMLNILVVEDDVKLNQIVCTYLNDNGYNAKGASGANNNGNIRHRHRRQEAKPGLCIDG